MNKKKKIVSKDLAERIQNALKEKLGVDRGGLFPPHIDVIRSVSELEFEAGDEKTYSMLLESICGATDDSQPVEQYDGSLGVTTAFVMAHQAPVGQLQWNNNLTSIYSNPGNVSNVRWCSGTLISNDLFITAGHCFDQTGGGWLRPLDNITGTTISPQEIATNMHVNFNYQVDPSGTLRVEQSFQILALVEYRLGGLDFAIVRLGGNPGATWGTTQIATTDAASGDMLCIIGHPAGWPKRIEAGPCLNVSGTTITYDNIDTLGGNSGSGILRANDGRIVGIHTNGGCGTNSPGFGANSGVRITSIIAQSPTLQNLTNPTIKEIPKDPINDPTIKEINKDPINDPTFKEIGKDPINDPTFKEIGKDPLTDPTIKEIRKDPINDTTIKEIRKDPITDPMPTIRETIFPGPFLAGQIQPGGSGGVSPFVMGAPSRIRSNIEGYSAPQADQLQIQQLIQYITTLEQNMGVLMAEYEAAIQQLELLEKGGSV